MLITSTVRTRRKRLVQLLCVLSIAVLISQGAAAGTTYVNPALSLRNSVDDVWPKCFYKYLTLDVGHRTQSRDIRLSLNWLDNVDTLTAYRIAFPLQVTGTWKLDNGGSLELTALTINSVSERIESSEMVESRYTRSFPLGGATLDLVGIARAFPSAGWAVSASPGAAVAKELGDSVVTLAVNELDAQDYATLGRGSNVVSVGATWSMPGGASKVHATLNTLLGSAEPTRTRTWLDLRFLFGSLYQN